MEDTARMNKLLFDDSVGIESRFRNKDYILEPDEMAYLENYVQGVAKELKTSGVLRKESVQYTLCILEILTRSPEEESAYFMQKLFNKFKE